MFSLLLIVILILLCTTSSKSLRIFYNLLIQSNEFSLNKITYDNQLKLLVSTFFLLQKDANVKKRKRKKESREPESNQWPKDYSFDTSTVFRSTNWAIAGSFCLFEKWLLNSLTNHPCITQKKTIVIGKFIDCTILIVSHHSKKTQHLKKNNKFQYKFVPIIKADKIEIWVQS